MNSPVTSEVKNSPIIEPKREDLTSRLQKEFGLLVDNDANTDDTGGDATPEEDNSPPPPPPAARTASVARARAALRVEKDERLKVVEEALQTGPVTPFTGPGRAATCC